MKCLEALFRSKTLEACIVCGDEELYELRGQVLEKRRFFSRLVFGARESVEGKKECKEGRKQPTGRNPSVRMVSCHIPNTERSMLSFPNRCDTR
jgi:hypothetical protein